MNVRVTLSSRVKLRKLIQIKSFAFGKLFPMEKFCDPETLNRAGGIPTAVQDGPARAGTEPGNSFIKFLGK